MNLAHLGLTAMNAAQNRLMVTGHNINNAHTNGYNRQRVLASTAGAAATGAGYVGRGVQVVTIQRAYDGFLFKQLVQSQTRGASLIAYGNEISQVNNLLGDREAGISAALQKFFAGVNAVASSPADPAARQELLGQAGSLVNQINNAHAFLDSQRNNINTQLSTAVTQVNSYLERLRDMNRQITLAQGSGHVPNDLLDQRDQLLNELSQIADVQSTEHADGTLSLAIGNGQPALSGDTVYPLRAVPSAADPSRLVLAYSSVNAAGKLVPVELPDTSMQGGTLGGLLQYRRQTLDAVQNDLGRMAAGLALAVNKLHTAGVDANGNPGEPFFTLGDATAIGHANNQGNASLKASLSGDASDLTASDYRIRYENGQYTVTRLSDKVTTTFTSLPADLDGLTIRVDTGTPADGDTWLLQPTRQTAGSIGLNLTDPAKIAAASASGGAANGENALRIAALQTEKILGNGTASLNEAFAQIVNKVAVLTQENGSAAKTQATLIEQNYARQQSVSGVNVDEEMVMLDQHLEQFRAASRMIDVSSALFDALLSLRT